MANNKINKHSRLPIYYHSPSRRMFLGELGAFMIAIPLLPSLIPRVAEAATPNDFRRAVFLSFRHGSLSLDFDPRDVSYQNLAKNLRAGNLSSARLGVVFPSSYDSLKSKMTVLRGLDLSDAWGHNKSAPLCAGGRGDYNGDTNEDRSRVPDSIDTILSKKIYGSGGAPVRLLRIGAFGSHSFSFENYRKQDGITDTKALFDLVSQNIVVQDTSAPMPTGPSQRDLANLRKKKVVDYALNSIQRVMNSSDIATADRPMLEDYATLLSEIQGDIQVSEPGDGGGSVPNTYACGDFKYQQEEANSQAKSRKMCDITVAAMACGVTRLATMNLPSEHHYVHRVSDFTNRKLHADFIRDNVMPTAAHIMKLMDSIQDSNGKSMLENSCVLQTSDLASSKYENHHGCNFPVFVGGGLNGKLRMGQAIDYQDHGTRLRAFQGEYGGGHYGGRPYNELMITIMRSFGLTQADYSHNGSKGFGNYDCRTNEAMRETSWKCANYMKDVYLSENPNRDKTLDHYYLG